MEGAVDATITKTVSLPATPAEVWHALTAPDELSTWLGEVVELEPRPGGSMILRDANGSIRRGVVEEAEPHHLLVIRWRRLDGAGGSLHVGDATRVSFELEYGDGSTLLTVREERVPFATAKLGR
jgi:uncharacterized protein YndB with AHSA1/START domain